MNLWHKLQNFWGKMRIYMDTFDYDRMTPELAAYLGHRDRPRYLYPKDEAGNTLSSKPTPESEAAVNAWHEEHNALKAKCGEGEPRGYYQAHKEWLCRDETQQGEPEEHDSPSDKYRLVVTRHGTGPGTWNYSKGRVYRKTSAGGWELFAEVCRNYGDFPFAWVEGHKDGDDYLVM